MRLAIMQPYIFPYIGYFQLINAVDKFVIYDDVNFIKGGWINRNRILLAGKDLLFTIPLQDASPFKKINEVAIHPRLYKEWKSKFYKTINSSYAKAPFFQGTFKLLATILEAEVETISELATHSIISVNRYLEQPTDIVPTSAVYQNSHLSGKDRVLDICLKEQANQYINAPGGKELYSKEFFQNHGVILNFIQTDPVTYPQFKHDFVPWLSIIDVLMFNSVMEVRQLLSKYTLT